ncbi:MAG TPA: hypothetical protein VE135_09025 [Pyrinomonadaceae bacterium]|nr:hypothetical protein [Pyrinomonadaceae bacterium]
MSQALPNNLLHNPFHNRFNDPVTQRRDEMQAHENAVWLRERNANQVPSSTNVDNQLGVSQVSLAKVLAGVFALLIVLLVSATVLKAF